MGKEAYDDYHRYLRDKVLNTKVYSKLDHATLQTVDIAAEDLRVGDVVLVKTGERVPADVVLLYTTDKSGTVFIKTDQLDGETDWKVRRPV
jgi:phospholipid-translocating ATPase